MLKTQQCISDWITNKQNTVFHFPWNCCPHFSKDRSWRQKVGLILRILLLNFFFLNFSIALYIPVIFSSRSCSKSLGESEEQIVKATYSMYFINPELIWSEGKHKKLINELSYAVHKQKTLDLCLLAFHM